MKKSKNLLLALLFVFAGLMFSCSSDSSNNNDNDTTEIIEEVIEADSSKTVNEDNGNDKVAAKYICPAHCDGSDSETPGTCPVCEMELVENPDL